MKINNIFKSLVLGLAVCTFSFSSSFAQGGKALVGPSIIIMDNDAFDSELFFGGTIGGAYGISDNLAVGLNIGYGSNTQDINLGPFGSVEFKTTIITISPNVRYYFNEVFDGFNAGLDVNYNTFGADADEIDGQIGAAALFGYDHALNDQMGVGIEAGYGQIFFDEDSGDAAGTIKAGLFFLYRFGN